MFGYLTVRKHICHAIFYISMTIQFIMNGYQYARIRKIFSLTTLLTFVFSLGILSSSAQVDKAKWTEGKSLFKSNCAACHNPKADGTGPALQGVTARWEGAGDHNGKTGKQWLYTWIKNYNDAVNGGYKYAVTMVSSRPSAMNLFTGLKDADIDNILLYVENPDAFGAPKPDAAATAAAAGADKAAEGPVLGDPASYMTGAAYTAVFNDYLMRDLKVTMDRPYFTSAEGMGGSWNWKPVPDGAYWEPTYVSTARSLSEAMHRNTRMKVMVANGYYDLITPFFDAEYTFARHNFPQERIEMTYYEAGHMMYNRQEDFDALAKDVRKFLEGMLK